MYILKVEGSEAGKYHSEEIAQEVLKFLRQRHPLKPVTIERIG
jgi:hypothetical protein